MAVSSTMMPLGTPAPDFSLPEPGGTVHSLGDFADAPGVLVMFICNHCPFVKHVRAAIAEIGAEYQEKEVGVVAVMSNDVEAQPDDHPEKMAREVIEAGYTFPYLYDATQKTAKDFGAACTPDFFLFDGEKRLYYRGQLDGARPGNDVPVTGSDLRTALDAVLDGRPAPEDQKPSLGCNIKWKPGNAPDYFSS